jgi:hypothetical protein
LYQLQYENNLRVGFSREAGSVSVIDTRSAMVPGGDAAALDDRTNFST